MGALIEGESLSPRKKKEMLSVMPKRDRSTNLGMSRLFMFSLEKAKGRRIRAAPRNLIKARRNGDMFSSDSLKIGEAAPQIKLAVMRAKIALLCGLRNKAGR